MLLPDITKSNCTIPFEEEAQVSYDKRIGNAKY